MPFTRATSIVINSLEPASNDKQETGSGVNAKEFAIIDTSVNRKKYPGAFKFTDFDDVYFHGTGGIGAFDTGTSFKSILLSSWFRDDGSTTT